MKTIKVVLLTLLMLLPGLPVTAQDSAAPPALFMSLEDIESGLRQAAAGSASAAGWSVTISPGITVRRRSSAVDQYAVMHPYSMEIYRILEGSGTLVTGGRIIGELEQTTEDVLRTPHGIEGGLARQVKEGDILVLQPGTPHWFSHIDGDTITYMESRVRIVTHPVRYQ
ncbi:MAG: hypothetical protein RL120_01645 [Gammaproteobacteria bacterium]